MDASPDVVESIRVASRSMVRELGFMRPTLAATSYSPSGVHALLEIDRSGTATSAQLVKVLGLEKSSVSRLVGRLIKAGELQECADADARIKRLQLTAQGKTTVGRIHAYGQRQVSTALQHMSASQQRVVSQGLTAYANALKACRSQPLEVSPDLIEISTGYRPGLVSSVVQMHMDFYSKYSGFGQVFESQVATGMAEFVSRLDTPSNNIWVALKSDRIVGSVAIDGQDLGNNQAHLRWFILEDGCRGTGIGRKLLTMAIEFCDRSGFDAIQLWTFSGLSAARRLYESVDFALVHEEDGAQWGSVVVEQQFTRHRPL